MRTPRPGSRWTPRRQQARTIYQQYITSPAWMLRRRWWMIEHRCRTGQSAACAVCGSRTDLELHHHDYQRLGRERYEDLVPLCAAHHRHVHDVYDASRTWRRVGRRAASAGIIAAMRTTAAG